MFQIAITSTTIPHANHRKFEGIFGLLVLGLEGGMGGRGGTLRTSGIPRATTPKNPRTLVHVYGSIFTIEYTGISGNKGFKKITSEYCCIACAQVLRLVSPLDCVQVPPKRSVVRTLKVNVVVTEC